MEGCHGRSSDDMAGYRSKFERGFERFSPVFSFTHDP
jgi:hypothetical protein